MPTVSWSKAKTPTASTDETSTAAAETPSSTAVATVPKGNTAVVPANTAPDYEGEWSPSMNKDPYLSLFSNKSDNADEFPEWIGTYVVAKKFSLGKEIVAIPVMLKNWFEEKTEFGSGDIPDRWNTSAEAIASGKEYQTVGEVQFLVEVPEAKAGEDIVQDHAVEYGGKLYVPVKYTCRKTAFNTVYAQIRTDKNRWLKGRYANGQYRLGITKKTSPVAYLAPTIRNAGATPEAVSNDIREKHNL